MRLHKGLRFRYIQRISGVARLLCLTANRKILSDRKQRAGSCGRLVNNSNRKMPDIREKRSLNPKLVPRPGAASPMLFRGLTWLAGALVGALVVVMIVYYAIELFLYLSASLGLRGN